MSRFGDPETSQAPAIGSRVEYFANAQNNHFGQVVMVNQGHAIDGLGLSTLLNPITDASHTRDRRTCPPNSACLPGTRKGVLRKIRSWMDSSVLLSNPHCMWVYGYAGCGKSAIAQEIAQYYSRKGRLAASFFFFRGSGDRSRALRFARTVANQMAGAVPATVPLIRAAITADPGLLTTASLSAQFENLVYQPLNAIKWDRMAEALRQGPFLVVIDGLDECEDSEDIADFVQRMIDFFNKNPRTPLRVLITSRVEGHIHQQLHSSTQVRLLNLVDHTSNADISAALDAAVADAERSRILAACPVDWLTSESKQKLIEHIGGSFIFLNTIIRFLFNMNSKDGLTPIERLPLALEMNPGFDGLYKSILSGSQEFPHFFDIVSSIALAQEPLSIAQIADLVDIKAVYVVNVLVNLHAIIQLPGDDNTPITLWHTSLRDFLTSASRSGVFYARPTHHARIALRCIDLAISCEGLDSTETSPALPYAQRYLWDHKRDFFSSFSAIEGEDSQSSHSSPREMSLGDVRDVLYKAVLDHSKEIAHLLEITSALALLQEPVSVTQMTDLLDIEVACVLDVLKSLRAIIHDPKDPLESAITPRHNSLCEFLLSEHRSGPFFAHPKLHGRVTFRCADLVQRLIPPPGRSAWSYAMKHIWYHYQAFVRHGDTSNYEITAYAKPFSDLFFSNAPGSVFDSLYTSVLREVPDIVMDKLYQSVLDRSGGGPYFLETVSTLALMQEPVSVTQVADLLNIEVACVLSVLKSLRAIIHSPKGHKSHITPRHSSLRNFLLSETRSGSFFAHPTFHGQLALGCIDLLLCPTPPPSRPAWSYAKKYTWNHCQALFVSNVPDNVFDDPYTSILCKAPVFIVDELYRSILKNSQEIPHFLKTVHALALVQEPVSAVQMAGLLDIEVACVLDLLKSLRAIIHDPKDPLESAITPRHNSLCEFLLSEHRSGPFFAHPKLHGRVTFRCVDLVQRPIPPPGRSAWSYAMKHIWYHYQAFVRHGDTSNYKITAYAKPFSDLFFSNAPGSVFDSLYTSVLRGAPDIVMDELYKSVLDKSQKIAHLFEITSALALLQEPASVTQMADLLNIKIASVLDALKSLRSIIYVPEDPHESPITPRHGSLCEFLLSKPRSGSFFAHPAHHRRLASRCIGLLLHPTPPPGHPGWSYASNYVWDHYWALVRGTSILEITADVQFLRALLLSNAPDDVLDHLYTSILSEAPKIVMEELYGLVLGRLGVGPYFLETISTLALVQEPVSVAQMADLLNIEVACVLDVLKSLRAIIHVPKDPLETVIIPRHSSLCKFLLSERHSGPFYAHPKHHGRLAFRCIDLVLNSTSSSGRRGRLYATKYIWGHCAAFACGMSSDDGRRDVYNEILTNVQPPNDTSDDEGAQGVPRWLDIVDTMMLVLGPLSVAEIASLSSVGVDDVIQVLQTFRQFVQIPERRDTAFTFKLGPQEHMLNPFLVEFLEYRLRQRSTFAKAHRRLAYRCITLLDSPSYITSLDPPSCITLLNPSFCSPRISISAAHKYAYAFAVVHYDEFLGHLSEPLSSQLATEFDSISAHLQAVFPILFDHVKGEYLDDSDKFPQFAQFTSPGNRHPSRFPNFGQLESHIEVIRSIFDTILLSSRWSETLKEELLAYAHCKTVPGELTHSRDDDSPVPRILTPPMPLTFPPQGPFRIQLPLEPYPSDRTLTVFLAPDP